MEADSSEQVQVSATEIARLARVGRAAVSNWRRRYATFPEPSGGTTTSPSFDLHDVEHWLRSNGKLDDIDQADRLWLAVNPGPSPEAAADAFVRAVVSLVTVRGSATTLPEPFRSLAPGTDATSGITAVARETTDDVDDLVSRLYERLTQAVSRHVAVTSDAVADLIVDLAGTKCGVVYDPACGTGSLLIAAERSGRFQSFVGHDLDQSFADVALVRLTAAGATEVSVNARDSMSEPGDLQADVAVCHPPFGVRDEGGELPDEPGMWPYGLPPRGAPELAWVQIVLRQLRPGGTAVVAMPPSAGSRTVGRRVRAELIRRGALRAVVAIPQGALLPSTNIPVSLWVLQNPAENMAADEVVFVDASNATKSGRRQADWPRVTELAVPVVRDHLERQSVQSSDDVAVVPAIDLLDDEVDLSPGRYIERHVEPVTADAVRQVRDLLTTALKGMTGQIPDVESAESARPPAMVTVGELIRTGAVEFHQAVARPERDADDADADTGLPELTARDILGGREPSRHVPAESAVALRAGDVVVTAFGEGVRTHVIESAGAALGPTLYLLRPDLDAVDPWFLAMALRATSNDRFSTGRTTMRIDVRRLEVPRLPIDDQRALGDVFRQVTEVEQGLAEAARLGTDLSRLLIDGFTSGTVAPRE